MFSHALQSGQLGPLVKQFNLGEDAVLAAASADMEAFVKVRCKSSFTQEILLVDIKTLFIITNVNIFNHEMFMTGPEQEGSQWR